jgi:exopolysaccharide biosynthesis polyprenyl glycosylphosphotransferase
MDQHTAQERVRDRPSTWTARTARSLTPRRPALVGHELPPWRATAQRLCEESNGRERRLRRALSLADVFALAVSLTVAVYALSSSNDALHPIALLLFPALIAAAKTIGLYESDDQRIRKTTVDELPQLVQLGALLVLAVWLADWLVIGGEAGKGQALILGIVFVVAAVLGRRTARMLVNRRRPKERCLFAGDECSYMRLRTIFERHDLSSELVDRVPVERTMIEGGDTHGEAQRLLELIARNEAHRLIIGPHSFTNAMTFELLEAARDAGTRVSLLPDMLEVVGSSVDFDDLFGVTLLGVRQSRLSRSSKLLKRGFDLAGATVVLLLTAPVMAVIGLAIKLDSPGPVLFRQIRVGRGGEVFRIFKFRTMVDGADARKHELRDLNEAEGLFKIEDDPRITRIGHTLRRTSFDELPQVFNVLLGQMSLVGPRPLVSDEDGRIFGARRGRLRLTPGMTGQWQIAGSSRIPLEDMVKLDHLYVSNWTLWGDVKILLRTVPYVLSRSGL